MRRYNKRHIEGDIDERKTHQCLLFLFSGKINRKEIDMRRNLL
jgi:ferredoxin-thioredoxin reductase catalytic subunit